MKLSSLTLLKPHALRFALLDGSVFCAAWPIELVEKMWAYDRHVFFSGAQPPGYAVSWSAGVGAAIIARVASRWGSRIAPYQVFCLGSSWV